MRTKIYNTFFFDLDGTLTDSGEGILKCAQLTLEHFGVHVEDWHSLRHFMGPPIQDTFHEVYGFDEEKSVQARDYYRIRYNTVGLFENRVYDGIPEVLEDLKAADARLMVATSKPEVTSLRVLEHFDLLKYFEVIVGSEMDGRRDKKADVIREVFRRAGISEEEKASVLMIGDRRHDMIGAAQTGIDSLGIYSGYAEPGELEKAGGTYVVHSVQEMRELLRSLTARHS